jgi:DNA-binding XRE family transcriptional regulator
MRARDKLRRWLCDHDVDQKTLAEAIGVTPSAVNQLLRPISANPEGPKLRTAVLIATYTDNAVPIEAWLREDDP